MQLKPLFWKSCRIIACESRLELLWALFENEEMAVSQLSSVAHVSVPNASNQLRALNEFGLVAYRREKMNVIYRAEANDLVAFAPGLLEGLRACYERGDSLDSVMKRVTAFTHQRRVEVVRVLNGMPMKLVDLQEKTGMSSPALSRHLNKLVRRDVVREKGRIYSLVRRPTRPLDKALLTLALG
jgi:DNA-binding transcriptional ArsR family regulator